MSILFSQKKKVVNKINTVLEELNLDFSVVWCLFLPFTLDDVMAALERLFLKVVDSIQEFILRRLLGELQEVNNKTNQYTVV